MSKISRFFRQAKTGSPKNAKTIGAILPVKTKEKNQKAQVPLVVRFFERAITVALFIFVLGWPLFFLNITAQGLPFEKYLFFYLFLLFGLIAWATKGILKGRLKIKRSFLDWLALFFILAVVVATVFSLDKNTSIFGAYGSPGKGLVGILTLIIFVYFLVGNVGRRQRGPIILAFGLSNIFFVAAFFAAQLWPKIGPWSFDFGFNPLGASGVAVIFAAASLPLFLSGLLGARFFWRSRPAATLAVRGILTLALAGNLFFLFALNQFVFWPAAILGVLVLLVFLVAKIIQTKQNFISWPIAVFLILTFFYVVGSVNILPVRAPTEVGLSRNVSLSVAENSLKENLFFGTGPSTFKLGFAQFKPVSFNQTSAWNVYFDSAQGLFFEVAATLGLVGLLTLLLLLGGLIFIAVLSIIRAEQISDKLFLAGLLGSFSSLVLAAFFLAFNSILILLAFLIGGLLYAAILGVGKIRYKVTTLSLKASPQNALALASGFLFVSAGVVVFFALLTRAFIADFYALRAGQAPTAQAAVTQISRAINLVDYRATYYSSLGQYYMVLVNQEVQKPADQFDRVRALSYLQTAISAARQALNLTPNNVGTVAALASIYENATLYINDATKFAEDYYNRVLELEPNNPVPYVRLAVLRTNQAKTEKASDKKEMLLTEAIVYYQKALALKPNLAGAYAGIAFAYEALDDFEKAIEQMIQAVNLAAADLGYRFELARLYFNKGVKEGVVFQQEPAPLIEEEQTDQQQVSVMSENPKTVYVRLNNDLAVAEKILVNIIAVNDQYANAHYLLGLLYERTRQFSQAKKQYQATVELLPTGGVKDVLIQKINSL